MDVLFHRRPPSQWAQFTYSPIIYLTQIFYSNKCRQPTLFDDTDSKVRVVRISDTHNTLGTQPPIAPGDILIHAGDLSNSGSLSELEDALFWLSSQPPEFKVFIAGNHDVCLIPSDPDSPIRGVLARYPNLIYLCDSSIEVNVRGRALKIYGSPWTPKHGNWAFQYPRIPTPNVSDPHSNETPSTWSRIPPLTDIVITHGPPFAHLDNSRPDNSTWPRAGCAALLAALWLVRPKLHVFGHIYAARGVERVRWSKSQCMHEQILAGKAGWCGLLRLVWYVVAERIHLRANGVGRDEQATIMVNAAAVGGLKDEARKGAITVLIEGSNNVH